MDIREQCHNVQLTLDPILTQHIGGICKPKGKIYVCCLKKKKKRTIIFRNSGVLCIALETPLLMDPKQPSTQASGDTKGSEPAPPDIQPMGL